MHSCYLNTRTETRSRNNDGFMGLTHGLSCVALFLVIAAFTPDSMRTVLGSSSLAVIILAMINSVGSAYLPDLDNSSSTSKSALGVLGELLSVVFRTTSEMIQTSVRTKYDKDKPNPHRGFYHTIPAALLIGLLVYLLTQIGGTIPLPGRGDVTWGFVFAAIVSWLNLHIALSSLFKQNIRRLKKHAGPFGEVAALTISLIIVGSVFSQLPAGNSYGWLGVSVAFGMIVHDLGDMFTTAGVPITFPIPHRGKLWWTWRLTPIHAGGVVENYVFIPFFLIVSVAAFLRVLGAY